MHRANGVHVAASDEQRAGRCRRYVYFANVRPQNRCKSTRYLLQRMIARDRDGDDNV